MMCVRSFLGVFVTSLRLLSSSTCSLLRCNMHLLNIDGVFFHSRVVEVCHCDHGLAFWRWVSVRTTTVTATTTKITATTTTTTTTTTTATTSTTTTVTTTISTKQKQQQQQLQPQPQHNTTQRYLTPNTNHNHNHDQEFEKQAEIEAKAEAAARSASAAAIGEKSNLGGLKVDIDQEAIQLAREVRFRVAQLVPYVVYTRYYILSPKNKIL